uniref:Zn(2)-C6 fungal-type domain-containing protein n=1 Tax=Candidozyma auris TaxID=498019 RepID=A0A0L0P1F4_CANAR
MSANLYFAYSIKKEYSLPVTPNGDAADEARKERKKFIRACDACSIRKTKCDESRPCRNCYNNGLECTELRERKKMGPKKLRKRTLDTINALGKTRRLAPDLTPVADVLSTTPFCETVARALVPLTVPSLSLCLPEILNYLKNSNSHNANNLEGMAKDVAMASWALLLLAALSAKGNPPPKNTITELAEYVTQAHADFSSQLFLLLKETTTSATHYYMSLAELHMYGYFAFKSHAFCIRQLLHLRGAITHYQLISASSDSDITGLSELRLTLYTAERSACLFAIDEVFRGNCLIFSGPSSSFYADFPVKTLILDCCHDIFNVLEASGVFMRSSSLPSIFVWRYSAFETRTGIYGSIKVKAHEIVLAKLNNTMTASERLFVQVLLKFVLFRVLLLYAGEYSQDTVSNELLELITQTTAALAIGKDDPFFKIHIRVFSLIPQMLDLLRSYFESVGNNAPAEAHGRLKEYTHALLALCEHTPFGAMAEMDEILCHWFTKEANDLWTALSSESPGMSLGL